MEVDNLKNELAKVTCEHSACRDRIDDAKKRFEQLRGEHDDLSKKYQEQNRLFWMLEDEHRRLYTARVRRFHTLALLWYLRLCLYITCITSFQHSCTTTINGLRADLEEEIADRNEESVLRLKENLAHVREELASTETKLQRTEKHYTRLCTELKASRDEALQVRFPVH